MEYRLLEIDLSTGRPGVRLLPSEMVRAYIGGRGLAGRLLLDYVPRGTDALDPENVIMWLTGPLTATLVPGATKHVVATKSPVSGAFVDSYSSGKVGIHLKYAGYDGLVLKGRAPRPSYIAISDETVEIGDATGVWGLDAVEAGEALLARVGDPEVGLAVIGPAGENLVKFACINNDFYRQAGRGGVGAVMGSKSLKAILARGSGAVPCHDPEGFMRFHAEKLAAARSSPAAAARKRSGTATTFDVVNAAGMLPTRNFQQGTFPGAKDHLDSNGVALASVGTVACLGCCTPCGKIVEGKSPDGRSFRIEGPEYETLAMFGSNLGIDDLSFVAEANMLCDRLGVDTISMGNAIGFLMECREKGLLHGELEGARVRFGHPEGILDLIRSTATRSGVGNWTAEGVRFLAHKVGAGSDHFAMHSKGLEFPGYDPRRAFGAGLAYAVTPRGACHRRAWPPAREVLGNWPPFTTEGKGAMVKELFDERNILHSLIVCDFPTAMIPLKMADYKQYLYLACGVEYSDQELAEVADRVETTIRLFNAREGLTAKDDSLPGRILREPMPDGPARGQCISAEGFRRMLDDYYRLRGWDEAGIPTPETLRRLGLQGVGR